jgi:hypothetical protein
VALTPLPEVGAEYARRLAAEKGALAVDYDLTAVTAGAGLEPVTTEQRGATAADGVHYTVQLTLKPILSFRSARPTSWTRSHAASRCTRCPTPSERSGPTADRRRFLFLLFSLSAYRRRWAPGSRRSRSRGPAQRGS